MMQVVPRWHVKAVVDGQVHEIWLHDNHIENVLRQVAGFQFTANGLDRTTRITVTLDELSLGAPKEP